MLAKWAVEESRYLCQDKFVGHRIDRCRTGRGVIVDPYHVLELKNWVNVVAVTDELDLLLIREYRHAAGEIVTGLPSGTFDPGDDALTCVRRELREETGGEAETFHPTSEMFTNPATMTNRVSCFLALDVTLTGETSFDPGEDIETMPRPVTEVYRDLVEGRLEVQALHLASLYAAAAYVRKNRDPAFDAFRDAVERAYD